MADTPPRRERKTPRRVRAANGLARAVISLGGVGTIVAVTLIFAFLLWVVAPLFLGAKVGAGEDAPLAAARAAAPVVRTGVDGARLMGWTLRADGHLRVRRLSDASILLDRDLFPDASRPTATSFATGQVEDAEKPNCAFGFADGSLRSGRIGFVTEFLDGDAIPPAARHLPVGAVLPHEDGMLRITPQGQVRFDHLKVEIHDGVQVAKSAIRRLDLSVAPSGAAYAVLGEDGSLQIAGLQGRFNIMMDRWEWDVFHKPIAWKADPERGPPDLLRLDGTGNVLYLLWGDGHCERVDARDGVKAEVVEKLELLRAPARRVDRAAFLVGKTTLVVADDAGRLSAWFPSRPADAYPRDGLVTVCGHVLDPHPGGARVTALAPSARSRLLAAGYDDGHVRLFEVTTEDELVSVRAQDGRPVRGLAVAPKEDGLVAWCDGLLERWGMDLRHPEATLGSLFGKVWYEGQTHPQHVWQSKGGSDDFEPKLGLVVLIFGTLKATFYSLLIAAPLALLAALFTSEFLSPRWRAPIKSAIEIMAGLPSVVLGFLAAVVLAPFVAAHLVVVLCSLLTFPLTVLLGARLWQFLPSRAAVLLEGPPRLLAVAASLPATIGLAILAAPFVEAHCFAGDVMGWLNGKVGSGTGGWTFLLLPFTLAAVACAAIWFGGPWLRRVSKGWDRVQCAAADVIRWVVVLVGGVGLALALGYLLGADWFAGGLDPRGAGGHDLAYQPRNAMIVGFVMGFAIVPIIYTLAEDALSSVPTALREASLGCGATPWQTAWRVVVPTAMSGLFSALMIGLGRSVGETMIVLMASGNTPIMEWQPFSGMRALSANIATELPEAVMNSTHYRVLFLSGLVLFAMTFLVNTAAEVVRRRFRKRAAEL
jgi:phosphate transport system permease protein